MPLHIEQIAGDVIALLQMNYAAALTYVTTEQGFDLPLSPPEASSYFIGEPNRYRPFDCPAIFVISQRTKRRDTSGRGGNTVLLQDHDMAINIVVEWTDEESLTRMCWRHAQAVDTIINSCELVPGSISQYGALANITDIDYGVTYTRQQADQRLFRKDIWLAMLVRHQDQYTPVPIQVPMPIMGTVLIGAPGIAMPIVASVVDMQLTTTSDTSVLSYLPGVSAGNYQLSIYYQATAPTSLTLSVMYRDITGLQTLTPLSGAIGIGAGSVSGLFLSAVAGQSITLTATAADANVVYLSATLESLG